MDAERFRRGDVVWALDPYHADDPLGFLARGRPWLILNEGTFPPEDRFIACALTTKIEARPYRIKLSERDWVEGRSPKESQLDLTTMMVLKRSWIEVRVGALADPQVLEAKRRIKSWL